MKTSNERRPRVTKWLRWIARIWSLPIIVYTLMLFIGYTWSWLTTGVADPYAVEEVPLIETLQPILLFISIIGLGIAWRWEHIGAGITLTFVLVTLVLLLIDRPITEDFSRAAIPYLLTIIIAIPGVLFLVYYFRDR